MNSKTRKDSDGVDVEQAADKIESLDGDLAVLKQSIYEYKSATQGAVPDPMYESLIEDLEHISKKLESLPNEWRDQSTTDEEQS